MKSNQRSAKVETKPYREMVALMKANCEKAKLAEDSPQRKAIENFESAISKFEDNPKYICKYPHGKSVQEVIMETIANLMDETNCAGFRTRYDFVERVMVVERIKMGLSPIYDNSHLNDY